MYKIQDYEKKSKQIKSFKKVISIFFYVIIIPILVINITLIIKSFITPNKIPDFFGYKTFIIVSESMEPTLNVGDAIFVKDVSEDEIKPHDIISFHDGEDINTHRVIAHIKENDKKEYITKGDNNKNADKDQITYDKIEGKYQFKISHFGIVVRFFQSKITLFLLIVLVVLNICSNKHLKNKKEERKQKRKKYNAEKYN